MNIIKKILKKHKNLENENVINSMKETNSFLKELNSNYNEQDYFIFIEKEQFLQREQYNFINVETARYKIWDEICIINERQKEFLKIEGIENWNIKIKPLLDWYESFYIIWEIENYNLDKGYFYLISYEIFEIAELELKGKTFSKKQGDISISVTQSAYTTGNEGNKSKALWYFWKIKTINFNKENATGNEIWFYNINRV